MVNAECGQKLNFNIQNPHGSKWNGTNIKFIIELGQSKSSYTEIPNKKKTLKNSSIVDFWWSLVLLPINDAY